MIRITQVIKRDGTKQILDLAKIDASIKKAAIDGGINIEQEPEFADRIKDNVTRKLSERQNIETSEIRSMILNELDVRNRRASRAWRDFDSRYKTPVMQS